MPSNVFNSRSLPKRHNQSFTFAGLISVALILSCALFAAPRPVLAGPSTVRLPGYVPTKVSSSFRETEMPSQQQMRLSFVLHLRNQGELSDLLNRLYDPKDPLYGHYLTTAQFNQEFGPSQSDVQAVTNFAQANGLRVADVTPDNMIVHVEGPVSSVESALSVRLWTYKGGDGRVFYAPTGDPAVPSDLAGRLVTILGLDNSSKLFTHIARPHPEISPLVSLPPRIGNGPQGSGLDPNDIKLAYNLKNVTVNGSGTTPLDGTGQTLGLFELDAYAATDITGYETQYGLAAPTLQNVAVDGGVATPGGGQDEVTLDIEMMIALAPKMTKLIVYEAPNGGTSAVDVIDRIATDDLATEVSTSWGLPEDLTPSTVYNAESQALQEMATHGQSYFDAAGDNGAFDDPTDTSPTVDDPGGQPFLTAVGGTTLFVNADGSYDRETTWADPTTQSGGGGGISAIWPIPSYQVPVVNASSDTELSKSNRNMPDVSLDADPATGYSIFLQGTWQMVGGTSAAAPLWAAFTALLNQERVANGEAVVGFFNPSLYQIAVLPTNYASDFHDIADNSTNLLYHAEPGYDLATGLGTLNGGNFLLDPEFTIALNTKITGTVTTPGVGSGAQPVALAGATVTESLASTGQEIQTTTTASDGTYTIEAPAATNVTLTAKLEGYESGTPMTVLTAANGGTLANVNFSLAVSPHTFTTYKNPTTGVTSGIQMVSSPFIYTPGLSIADILGATSVKVAVWDPALDQPSDYVLAPIFPADTFRLGQGYWLLVPNATQFYSISQPGQLSTANSFTIDLDTGWNMIGDPFDGDVATSGITVGTTAVPFATAITNKVVSIFYTWQASDTAYEQIDSSGDIVPWEGYWIFAYTPTSITLPSPP